MFHASSWENFRWAFALWNWLWLSEAALDAVRPCRCSQVHPALAQSWIQPLDWSPAIPIGCNRWFGTCCPMPSSSHPPKGKWKSGSNVWVGLHRSLLRIQGKGISAEFLPFVFDRFRQADSSSTRVHGGLGIGPGLGAAPRGTARWISTRSKCGRTKGCNVFCTASASEQ